MVEEAARQEEPNEGRPGSPTKFIIGGLIIVAVVVYLIFSSIGGSTAYYLTVAELRSQGDDAIGERVRVTGLVDGDTIDWDDRNLDLAFDIVDDSGRLSVTYHGVRPDMFQGEAEAVVEGALSTSGVFEANNLLLKCPSKYEESGTAQAES
jgi:cytochrome c-type biogenesis protein CcmE